MNVQWLDGGIFTKALNAKEVLGQLGILAEVVECEIFKENSMLNIGAQFQLRTTLFRYPPLMGRCALKGEESIQKLMEVIESSDLDKTEGDSGDPFKGMAHKNCDR